MNYITGHVGGELEKHQIRYILNASW